MPYSAPMFTGVIKEQGKVVHSELVGASRIVRIEKPKRWRLSLGESISVNGICTTVRSFTPKYFEVEYMPETVKITTAGAFEKGDRLHLEKSLRMMDAIDGHFVQGHVDATATVSRVERKGESYRITFRIPPAARRLCIPWGSITVDGVSLTIQELGRDSFTVALIEHTRKETVLGDLKKGDHVNIETDMFARYVAQLIKR
jgi:riboflavin synthase